MHDILATLMPIYKIMRYLGYAAYTVEGPPKSRYVKYSPNYEITANLIHMAIVVYSSYFYSQGLRQFNRRSTLVYIGSILYLSSGVCFLLVTPIFNKIQNNKTISTLTRLYEVEKKLTKIGVRVNYDYLYKLSNVIVLVTFMIFSAYFWTFGIALMFSNRKLLVINVEICILYYWMSLLQILTTAQYWVSFTILGHLFRELNRFTSTKILNDSANKLRSVAAIHQELCKISRNFNKMLSVKVLLLFGTFFLIVTLHVYSVTLTLINVENFDSYSAFSFATAVFYLCTMAVYTIVSSQCMNQAGLVKKILFKILTNSNEPRLKSEIKAFSLQILHEEFNTTAAGFFTIDSSLLTTIVGTLITYVTILVQYDSTTNVRDNFFNY